MAGGSGGASTDDCGNTLNTGDVTVSFSNGDPALNLLPVQARHVAEYLAIGKQRRRQSR